MKLSIVITHHKEPRLLLKLLKSLTSRISNFERSEKQGSERSEGSYFQTLPSQHSAFGGKPIPNYEIIVVDSEAQKELGALIRKEFPEVRYIPFSKNVGYAKIVNVGLQRARAPFILIVNADIIITAKGIEKMRFFLESEKGAAAVGVSDCFTFPAFAALIARRTFLVNTLWGKRTLWRYEMQDYQRGEPQVVDWVRGDCWMVKKSALKKVGLMDERFFMYFEDTDWCRRAKEKGLSVFFLPGVKIVQQKLGASREKSIKGFFYRLTHFVSFLKYRYKWNRVTREFH